MNLLNHIALYGGEFLNVLELEKQSTAPLAAKTIRGQISDKGRHRGRPYPYGACNIVTPPEISLESKIEWLAEYVAHNIDNFKKCGAEDIVFWIVWRGAQGNMELSTNELQKIASLNIPMAMNYYYVSTEEDDAYNKTTSADVKKPVRLNSNCSVTDIRDENCFPLVEGRYFTKR